MTSTPERIRALHAWYCANVIQVRLTPEVERLWFEFFRQGYNGHQLARVVRYLRGQISTGKRNEGALKLRNMLSLSEDGALAQFDEDLGLASSRGNLQVDRKLSPLPDMEGGPAAAAPAPAVGEAPAAAVPVGVQSVDLGRRLAELEELRRSL